MFPPPVSCQNPACDYFQSESGGRIRRNGHNSAGNQRYYCLHCHTYFTETKNTPLYRSRLDRAEIEKIASLCSEQSIRSVSRTTKHHRATITRYFHRLSTHAQAVNSGHL
jgi:transposase-like protein